MDSASVCAGKELRVEMRLRNNRLYNLIFPRWDSVAAFCREFDLHMAQVNTLLNLKASPVNLKTGKYREVCQKIAKHFCLLEEDVFPLEIYNLAETNGSAEIGIEMLPYYECLALPAPDEIEQMDTATDRQKLLEKVLSQLSSRERTYVEMYYGLCQYSESYTFAQISEAMGITKARVEQVIKKAIARLQRDPKMWRAFYATETGESCIDPMVREHCAEIIDARNYIDALYDALGCIRSEITDARGPDLDAWFGLNDCPERGHSYWWTRNFEPRVLEGVSEFFSHPLLRDLLERADARELMQNAANYPIMRSYRARVQDMFWSYYRGRR